MSWLKNLQFIFRPSYWIMNEKYSEEWDFILNEDLKHYGFTDIGPFTAKLGPNLVWVANHPYASFTMRECPYNCSRLEGRPSRLTLLKAKKKLNKDIKASIPTLLEIILSESDKK